MADSQEHYVNLRPCGQVSQLAISICSDRVWNFQFIDQSSKFPSVEWGSTVNLRCGNYHSQKDEKGQHAHFAIFSACPVCHLTRPKKRPQNFRARKESSVMSALAPISAKLQMQRSDETCQKRPFAPQKNNEPFRPRNHDS